LIIQTYLPLTISLIALAISTLSFFFTLRWKGQEKIEAARRALTEAYYTIQDVQNAAYAESQLPQYGPEQRRAIRDDRLQIALARADRLSNEFDLRSSSVELTLLASAILDQGRVADANRLYAKAIKYSPDAFSKARTLRHFGERLARAGRFAEGKTHISKSAEIFVRLAEHPEAFQGDQMLAEAVNAYLRLIHIARGANNEHEATELTGIATGIAQRIGDARRRNPLLGLLTLPQKNQEQGPS
jgi:tetratricopeptide (TPR) repeat protein